MKPSPSHKYLAFSVDYSGNETFSVVIRDLATGTDTSDVIEGVAGGASWGGDDGVVFYCTEDEAKRPYVHGGVHGGVSIVVRPGSITMGNMGRVSTGKI